LVVIGPSLGGTVYTGEATGVDSRVRDIAMPLFELTSEALVEIPTTTFTAEQVLERADLQRLLRARPEVLVDDVLIVSEEFGAFTDAHRRIDLLGVDRQGRLVVIELKRTSDGGHLELQALRYAAMVSAMTFEDLVEHYGRYLTRLEPAAADDARARLAEFLEEVGGEDAVLSREVRLVLVSSGFDREITTTVLWLNDVFGLDIRCVRLNPYKMDGRLILDVQQLIPLPEASDLTVQLRRRENQARAVRAGAGPDWTPFIVQTPQGRSAPLRKRRAMLALVTALVEAGVTPDAIASVLPRSKFLSVAGHPSEQELPAALVVAHPPVGRDARQVNRWFVEAPLRDAHRTWVLSKMWGLRTEAWLNELLTLAPGPGYAIEAQRE
jgi:hypothetical protein